MTTANPWAGTASTGGGTKDIPDEGTHPAVCVALIDLGTHEQEFKDKDTGEVKSATYRKILFVWELTDQSVSGTVGKNHTIGKDFNVAFSDKAGLRKMLEKWRGKVYADGETIDPGEALSKSCLLTITHGKSQRGNDFAKWDGVAPVPKKFDVPAARIKPFTWRIGDAAPLPTWLPFVYGESPKDIIDRSQEMKANQPRSDAQQAEEEPQGDSIPF